MEQQLFDHSLQAFLVNQELAGIPYRNPIRDEARIEDFGQEPGPIGKQQAQQAAEHVATCERQWGIVAHAMNLALDDPETRAAIIPFASKPLGEGLPLEVLQAVAAVDARTDRVRRYTAGNLGAFLALEPVPDALYIKDVRTAPELVRRSRDHAYLLKLLQSDPARYNAEVEDYVATRRKLVLSQPGVTKAEQDMTLKRYDYARTVKELALAAELREQPFIAAEINETTDIVSHTLESGTKLVMTKEAYGTAPDILNPAKWQGRNEIKDRVHSIQIAGKDYIMKARKTSRHGDTFKGGHRDGLSSSEEFQMARDFAGLGVVEHNGVQLSWERPIGYVEFIDGYQFCLFEKEPDLQVESPKDQLVAEYLAEPAAFADEYRATVERAQEICRLRPDLLENNAGDATNALAGVGIDELTYHEFAELKADFLEIEARVLLEQTVHDQGRAITDRSVGYGFSIQHGDHPSIKIIAFDFEYYENDPDGSTWRRVHSGPVDRSGDNTRKIAHATSDNRDIELAASYAILEKMGWDMPAVQRAR
jgi:hypothetical protein